jgi:mono/diheme cytochrome c family protein
MQRISFFLTGSLFAVISSAAGAQDATAGRQLAVQWCSACHLVAPDQARAPTVAPTFASIAKNPGFNVGQLSKSLLAPHPQMPGRELAREQAADIAAYIATLAR